MKRAVPMHLGRAGTVLALVCAAPAVHARPLQPATRWTNCRCNSPRLEINRQFKRESDWLKQIEPYLLLEAAQVSTRIGDPAPRKPRSVALGVRLSDTRHCTFDLAIAKPTGDAAPSNPARKPRLTLLLSYQLEAP